MVAHPRDDRVGKESLDVTGPALLSVTGLDDRLRLHCLLAYVDFKPTKRVASFRREGAWEYDPVQGTGTVRLAKDGRLYGRIRIQHGDESTFIASRTDQPAEPIPPPPRCRDKWRRRW